MGDFNHKVSIAKGICIVLMVVGHSACPIVMKDFIYLFHIPLFFFVSGFLVKEEYFENPKKFIVQRFKGLYIPFVKWSLIFLLFHNLFYSIYLYDSSYSFSDYISKGIKIITLRGTEQLLGGFWFLKELLICSIFCFFILYILKKVCSNLTNNKNKYVSIVILSLLIISIAVSEISFLTTTTLSRTLLGSAIFLMGFLLRGNSFEKKNRLSVAIAGLSTCLFAVFFFSGDMTGVRGLSLILYFILSIIGCIGVLNLSGLIKGKLFQVFDYLGKRTLDILVFHFLAFKLVSFIKIYQYDLRIDSLAQFPVIASNNSSYWVIYSIVGVVVPILISETIAGISKSFRKTKV